LRRVLLAALALAACADTPPPAPVQQAGTPAPVAAVTRYDGTWSGNATRTIGTDTACGAATQPMQMTVVQGRAAAQLPRPRDSGGALGIDGRPQATALQELIGTVQPDGGLMLRARLDAAERAEGRFGERGFTARYQSRGCAWNIALSRVG
jgi:hypothetical protein